MSDENKVVEAEETMDASAEQHVHVWGESVKIAVVVDSKTGNMRMARTVQSLQTCCVADGCLVFRMQLASGEDFLCGKMPNTDNQYEGVQS